jgi:hypothetical protein
VRLLVEKKVARRLVGLAGIMVMSLPFGVSVIGCGHKAVPVTFCNAGDSGPIVGQVAKIILSPSLATVGESLNYGQIGQALSASAEDCKGNAVSVSRYTYASTSSYTNSATTVFADINPNTGQVCGGTWNRNVGGGVPDYTTCTAPTKLTNPANPADPANYVAYVTATANGAVSNAIPVYVHPVVTGVVLGGATPAGSCPSATNPLGNDPGTDCSGCSPNTVGTTTTAGVYNGNGGSCLSQTKTGQLVARVYAGGGTSAANNITCQVGHLSYGTENASNVVVIDQNGVATANQPGSTQITASIANSSSSINAGFFSTCPPASIALSAQGYSPTATSIPVNVNNVQALSATVLDTAGFPITGLPLEYNSTEPQLVPGGSGSITPLFPGSATITAVCQPGTCNPSGFSQIGVQGNGKPITSNGITFNVPGRSGTVIYGASLTSGTPGTSGYVPGSQYLFVQDFTTGLGGTLVKLPYAPNSLVMSLNGQSIYMGSAGGLIAFTTASNAVSSTNQAIPGTVLSLSPDQSTLVVTDPVRQTISLVTAGSSSVSTTYGGVGTRAAWSPDSGTVYVTTTTGAVLSHSQFTNWETATAAQTYTDVAVTVPHVGALFAGPLSTDGRSYCSTTTSTTPGNPPTATNTFLPIAGQSAAPQSVVDRLGVTNDGLHALGAHVFGGATAPSFTDMDLNLSQAIGACQPVIPTNYFGITPYTLPLTGLIPTTGTGVTSITGVLPANNSLLAFVTYTGTTGGTGLLPYYTVPATGLGTLKYLPLNGTATAPLAGVWSSDNLTFYVGTAGDNAIHQIGVTYPSSGAPVVVDSPTSLSPNLPSASGTGIVPVNLIVAYTKKTTS